MTYANNFAETLGEVVENTTVQVVCFSQSYQNSFNCRQEALYAFQASITLCMLEYIKLQLYLIETKLDTSCLVMQDLDNSRKTSCQDLDRQIFLGTPLIRSWQDLIERCQEILLAYLDKILTILGTWKILSVSNPEWGGRTGNPDKSWPWPDNPDKKLAMTQNSEN